MNPQRLLLSLAAFSVATHAAHGGSPRRYRPQVASCSHCRPHHVLLFAAAGDPRRPQLRKCFSRSEVEGSAGLRSVLGRSSADVFVLVMASVAEPELLSVMVERLGNVSVVLPKNASLGRVSRRCDALGPACEQMDSLGPIVEEVRGREGTPRWVLEEGRGSQSELERLLGELCKRDKSRNRVIEIRSRKEGGSGFRHRDAEEDLSVGLTLKDILPLDAKSYDKNRPPKMGGKPTVVYFHVTVLSLDSIDEESMTYVADIFLAQSWRDPRLRLPESMSQEYRILDVGWLHDIWRPDSFFKNAKRVTFHEITVPNHYVWLYHDKTLLYVSKLTLVLSCAMKFESYPHDIQVCSMMIESLSHTARDLVFLWNLSVPLVVNPEIELPQLDISSNYTSDCTVQYSTGNFTCLAVVFTLKRRLGYHLLHTYIPSALIVVMSWISFWIRPEAIPARVTLGVTSLLTLATQNTQSQQSLPPVSYVKAIDIWMSSCSVFVFLSLMEFAVVNNCMGPRGGKGAVGCSEEDLRGGVEEYRLEGCVRKSGRMEEATCGKEAALCIDRFSRYFFPISFFVLNVVYWSVFL